MSRVRDAGICVGRSKDIVVRGNVTSGSVTGIEIENSIGALVEDDEVRGNDSCGIAVSGLQSFFGGDGGWDVDPRPERCWIHDNVMADNGGAPAPTCSGT